MQLAQDHTQIDLVSDRCVTSMTDSKLIRLSSHQDWVSPPEIDSPVPFVNHAHTQPGPVMAGVGHPGWTAVVCLDGDTNVGGARCVRGDVVIAEPYARWGPVTCGPNGFTAIGIYENGAGGQTYFPEQDDPDYLALKESIKLNGTVVHEFEPPPGQRGLPGKIGKVDLTSDRLVTPFSTSKTWELGPLGECSRAGWETIERSSRPFLTHVRSEHGQVAPPYSHRGWRLTVVLEGTYVTPFATLGAGEMVLSAPGAPMSDFEPGTEGVTALLLFDTGACVKPIVNDAAQPASEKFDEALGIT